MVSSRWSGALCAVLASSALAWGQAPPPAANARKGNEKIVGVRELDGPEQKARLLQNWTTPTGQKACQVQLLETGEMLTIVESGRAANGKTVGAQIYHWGNSTTSPDGVPTPGGTAGKTVVQALALQPSPAAMPQIVQGPEAAKLPASTPPTPSGPTGESAPACAPPPCPPTGCATGACGQGEGCPAYVYRYERVPRILFKPGCCVPVIPPYHAPNYGYHQTQWRTYPGAPAPATSADELPMEASQMPMVLPARYRY